MSAPSDKRLTPEQRHEGVVTALSAMHAALLALLTEQKGSAREHALAAVGVIEALEADLGDPMSPRDLN